MTMHRPDCQPGVVVVVKVDGPLEEIGREQGGGDMLVHGRRVGRSGKRGPTMPTVPILTKNILFPDLATVLGGEKRVEDW